MSELSQFDREDLIWKQKTLRARKWMKPDQQLAFAKFMEAGGARFDWPGWEILVGPKPGIAPKKKLTVTISEKRRKSA